MRPSLFILFAIALRSWLEAKSQAFAPRASMPVAFVNTILPRRPAAASASVSMQYAIADMPNPFAPVKIESDDDEYEVDDDEEAQTVEVYDKIGIAVDDLALGVNPVDVLNYLGTRDDLVAKTKQDLPKFDDAKVQSEVDKFLLDADALIMYIQFQKKLEEDPDFTVTSNEIKDEGPLSFRNLVAGYIAYVAISSGPIYFRRWVGDQQEAGTWQGTGIGFVDDWINKTPIPVTASEAAASSVDAVSSSADAAVQAVSDAVQTAADVIN